MRITSFNCQNFKSNRVLIDKIVQNFDVIFLCEHWLNSEEYYLLTERYTNHNLFFQSDMEVSALETRGRPFGGKCWLVSKSLNVLEYDFFNSNYS